MLQGTIIENSLTGKEVLKTLTILNSWSAGSWQLHHVSLSREQALSLSEYIADGPWYAHFWELNKEDVLVIFKDEVFDIKYSDRSTWDAALEYGRTLGIPEEQLNFKIL